MSRLSESIQIDHLQPFSNLAVKRWLLTMVASRFGDKLCVSALNYNRYSSGVIKVFVYA